MGSRSRKRTRASAPAAAPKPPAARRPQPGPLDEFSAIAVPATVTDPEAGPAPTAAAPDGAKPKRLRGEAANEAVRAGLKPLAPGERPPALLTAIALATVLGVANLVLALANVQVDGQSASPTGGVVFAVIVLGAAWGMWQVRYWAILGFQTLLAITVVIAALAITVSSNFWALLLCLTVVGLFGWQFWKLVRVLARVQMPERPGR